MADTTTRQSRLLALYRLGQGEEFGDFAAHRELMHPQFQDFRLGAWTPVAGVEAYIESVGDLRAALDNYHVDVPIDPIIDAQHVVTTWVINGSMVNDLWGMEATGHSVAWRGCSVWSFATDERILELRTFADLGQLLGQLTDGRAT